MPKKVWFGVVGKAVAAEQLMIFMIFHDIHDIHDIHIQQFINAELDEVNASFHCFKCHSDLYFDCGVCGFFGCQMRKILRFWADKYNLLWGARRHGSVEAS